MPLYLASASPRRRQLLTEVGVPFEQFVVPVDEAALSTAYTGPLELLGEYLARSKALAARDALQRQGRGRTGRILASDTTVLLDERSLPKPRDEAEARAMLETLRGREHIVATGVAVVTLVDSGSDALVSATSTTRVLMRNYGDAEIADYVATGDPLDKAGAYSIQHPDFHPVAKITGCHLGVIGLPVCIVAALLEGAPLPPSRVASGGDYGKRCLWSAGCRPPLPDASVTHTQRDLQTAP